MIRLTKFIDVILEGSKTKFDIKVTNFDNLSSSFPSLVINKNEVFVKFLNELISKGEDKYIICADQGTYFKIPYSYSEAIIELAKSYDDITATTWATKVKVYGKVNNRKRLLFVTGEGSISKVSTEEQETATCLVWNSYIDLLKANPDTELTKEMIKEFVKEIIKDESWESTFAKQIAGIAKAAKHLKIENITDYKLCRYGTTEDDDNIGSAYASYLNKYAKALEVNKHNVDPTDILLYNENNTNEIISILKSLSTSDNIIDSKNDYIEKLINTKLLLGISLKKIYGSEADFDIYNIGSHTSIDKAIVKDDSQFNYRIINTKGKNYFKVECTGKFNFDKADIANSEGTEITKENLVILQMRTFGNDQVGLECYIKNIKINSPAIGKCSKKLWSTKLDISNSDKILDCIEKFRNTLGSLDKEEAKTLLIDFILDAIKEGPNCFPFILIH